MKNEKVENVEAPFLVQFADRESWLMATSAYNARKRVKDDLGVIPAVVPIASEDFPLPDIREYDSSEELLFLCDVIVRSSGWRCSVPIMAYCKVAAEEYCRIFCNTRGYGDVVIVVHAYPVFNRNSVSVVVSNKSE